MQAPKSKKAFRRWLCERFDEIEAICEFGQPDFYESLDIAALVGQACRYACRWGAGHLIGSEHPTMTPRQALVVIGRLLAWSGQPNHQPDLLSVSQVAEKLGLSVRSVWRMSSAGNLPAPIAVSGRSLWKAPEVDAMIDLSLSRK
jgi:predicted DNA-binding transcriptional regulator AlpA